MNMQSRNEPQYMVLYLLDAVNFHVWVRVHPAVPVAGHRCRPLFDGAVAAVAHEADHGYYHGQHRSEDIILWWRWWQSDDNDEQETVART